MPKATQRPESFVAQLDDGTVAQARAKSMAFLPRSYMVVYWDEATGRLLRSEAVKDRWRRVGDFDLPVEHTVARSLDTGHSVRSFTLSKHELLP